MNYWDYLARQKADRETYQAITPQGRSIGESRAARDKAADDARREIDFLRRQHAEDQATIAQLRNQLAAARRER